jgi:four helix bundle protein
VFSWLGNAVRKGEVMKDFRKLRVWEKAHKLTLDIYQATSIFPKEEIYGLTSQIRRASVSIPANIAEGCGRDSEGELLRYLRIAMGSSSELEYELLLASDLGYIPSEKFEMIQANLVAVRKMLNALIQRIKTSD